jgi:molecular chaperone DnaJ
MTQDYYETLNVSKNASSAEIKKSFKRLAMKYHPDRNPDDKSAESKFKAAKEAYEVLSDNQKRARYDQFGHAGVNADGAGGFGGAEGFSDLGDIFGDIFGDMFGGGQRANTQRAQRGNDLLYTLEILLEEAVHGASRNIKIPTKISCTRCSGKGSEPGSTPTNCQHCQGRGKIHIQQGFLTLQQTCPGCHGQGQVITNPCKSCNGAGRENKNISLDIKIPVGINNGDKMRVTGKGEAGLNGGPCGDLFIQIRIKPHEIFSREGQHLTCEVPISIITAALGGEIEVPTLHNKVKLKIPSETQSNSTFRLGGKGIPKTRNNPAGDLLCKIIVETPIRLNSMQKEHLRKFQSMLEEGKNNHSPRSKKWYDNISKFFKD